MTHRLQALVVGGALCASAAALTLLVAWHAGAARAAAARAGGAHAMRIAVPAAAAVDTAATREARTLVRLPRGRLGFAIRFERPAGATPDAQVDLTRHVVRVFVGDAQTPQRIAHELAHEFGHVYDSVLLSDAQRMRYLEQRARSDARWWPRGDESSDYGVGAGDFAEVFAACHAPSPDFRSTLAAVPRRPCSLLPDTIEGGA